MFHKARAPAFDLDTAASLLLNMLHVSSAMTYNLSSKIEPRNRFEVDWNFLFWPFALLRSALVIHSRQTVVSLLDRIHLFLLLQALFFGSVFHRPDLVAPVS
jgi:hypothetical protein